MKGKQQATVAYSFAPADAFAGRPIGLVVNLQYRDHNIQKDEKYFSAFISNNYTYNVCVFLNAPFSARRKTLII